MPDLTPRGLLLRLGLALASLTASLGAAEVALRSGFLEERLGAGAGLVSQGARSECARPSPVRGWEGRPDACGRGALGIYDGGHALSRPEGTPRVLVLGDSVSADDTWARSLEAGLRSRLHPELQVWNAGVAGYDTCQEASALRELLPRVEPDLVLVQTCVNDLDGSLFLTPAPGAPGSVEVHLNGRTSTFPRWLFSSRLLAWGALSWAAHGSGSAPSPSGPGTGRRELVGRCFADLASAAREAGVPLGVLHFPVFVAPGTPDPGRRGMLESEVVLQQLTAEADLPSLALRPVLAQVQPIEVYAKQGDPIHMSYEAALLVGDLVAASLAGAPITQHLSQAPEAGR